MTTTDWLDAAIEALRRNEPAVLVTVVDAVGSTPREAGAKMLVRASAIVGSIGGGNLEHQATARARALFADVAGPAAFLDRAILGPDLGQCCGGRLVLLFERLLPRMQASLGRWRDIATAGDDGVAITAVDGASGEQIVIGPNLSAAAALPPAVRARLPDFLFGRARCALIDIGAGAAAHVAAYVMEALRPAVDDVYLFGAGHVGQAVALALAPLPFALRWIDSRADAFPSIPAGNVAMQTAAHPELAIDDAPPGCFVLVMTHDHGLDLEICDRALRRDDLGFVGLIGSATKRARFLHRLRERGIADAPLARLVCPIGVPGIAGKQPAVIAAAVAAQLLALAEARRRRSRPSDAIPADRTRLRAV